VFAIRAMAFFPRIGSVPFPIKPYLLGKPPPGRRQPVKAASREAVARHAPALTGWRWSGLLNFKLWPCLVRSTSRVLEKLSNPVQQLKMGRMKQRRLDPKSSERAI
jgi:hypothetical protein